MQRRRPRLALGTSGGDEQNRKLVNRNRHQRLINRDAMQTRRTDAQIGDRFAARLARVQNFNIAAHRAQNLDHRGARRVHADVLQQQLALTRNQSGNQKKRRRRHIARYYHLTGGKPLPAANRQRRAVLFNAPAETAQHPLAVVATDARLRHPRRAVGEQPGEQQRRLQLRARHRQGVINAMQRAAMNNQRRRTRLAGGDFRAHQGERLGDAAHWPLHQRTVADQHTIKRLPGKHARKQTHTGAAVADIQRRDRRAQPVQPRTVNRHPPGAVVDNLHPHRLKCAHGGETILAFKKTADLGRPLCQRTEHHCAVGNGLVARHAHRASNRIHRRTSPILPHKTSCKRKARII